MVVRKYVRDFAHGPLINHQNEVRVPLAKTVLVSYVTTAAKVPTHSSFFVH